MNTGWNHPYEAKVHVDGTLNRGADQDVAWTAEWRIPFAGLEASPKPGDRWKANLFRLDRVSSGWLIEHTDATAWSAPLAATFISWTGLVNWFFRLLLVRSPVLGAPSSRKSPDFWRPRASS